jgi:hypothetical protein
MHLVDFNSFKKYVVVLNNVLCCVANNSCVHSCHLQPKGKSVCCMVGLCAAVDHGAQAAARNIDCGRIAGGLCLAATDVNVLSFQSLYRCLLAINFKCAIFRAFLRLFLALSQCFGNGTECDNCVEVFLK